MVRLFSSGVIKVFGESYILLFRRSPKKIKLNGMGGEGRPEPPFPERLADRRRP